MIRSFNPLTATVNEYPKPTQASSLQVLCRNTILKAITITRVCHIQDLPLPVSLKERLLNLSLDDFQIDIDNLTPDGHSKRIYSATCKFDNQTVLLKVCSQDNLASLEDPSIVTSFSEDGSRCYIYKPAKSLEDVIQRHKDRGLQFQENVIWNIINSSVQYLLNEQLNPVTRLSPSNIRFCIDGNVYIESSDNTEMGQMTQVQAGMNAVVYEAPEVLGRQNPDTKAFSWSLGCLMYEMLALEPAFFDRSGTNPFSVYMDIMQGKLPPIPPPDSDGIQVLIRRCLKVNPEERISLEEILSTTMSYKDLQ